MTLPSTLPTRHSLVVPLAFLALPPPGAMLLVHKPQNLPPSSPSSFMGPRHKRNPSAPVVNVHATKTPGLLSLSKPPQRPAQSNNASLHPRGATPRQHRAKASLPAASANSPPATPASEKPRGRPSQARDKALRSSSRLRTHGGRSRQPSPLPIPTLPQSASEAQGNNQTLDISSLSLSDKASAPVSTGRSTRKRNRHTSTSDALRIETDSDPSSVPKVEVQQPSTPAPTSKASKRASMPAKAKARPAPLPSPIHTGRASSNPPATLSTLHITHSDPAICEVGPRQPLQRSHTEADVSIFPICDDNDDDSLPVANSFNALAPPRTPVRRSPVTPLRAFGGYMPHINDSDLDDSPHSTPLHSPTLAKTLQAYSFPATSPIRRTRPPMSPMNGRSTTSSILFPNNGRTSAGPASPSRPTHIRAPSFPAHLPSASVPRISTHDLLFNMSSDSSSDNDVNSAITPQALFQQFGGKRRPQSQGPLSAKPTRMTPAQKTLAEKKLTFANPIFQNSPSPDVLPPPPRFDFPSPVALSAGVGYGDNDGMGRSY